jgi:NAD+ synthase (glutamine-hydrolysing)
MLKLAIAQLNFTVGDFAGNSHAILDHMAQAAKCGAELLVFSELALCGYYPGDLLEDLAFLHKMDRALEKIKKASRHFPN